MNFLFLSVFICGALSHSLEPVNDVSLLERYKENPSAFIASMAEVDPTRVNDIIALLSDLKEKSEAEEARLINNLDNADRHLGQASNDVLNAEGVLSDAEARRDDANADHDSKERERAKRETTRDDAQTVVNNEQDALNDEQRVLKNVIELLNGLNADFVEKSNARNLLSLTASLTNPSFIAEMAKADPQAVANIIELLMELQRNSESRETEILDALAAAEKALGEASAAVVAAEEVWRGAQAEVDDAERDLASKTEAESVAQAKKDSAQNVHDAEVDGLNSEQEVLGQVIGALRDLISRQA